MTCNDLFEMGTGIGTAFASERSIANKVSASSFVVPCCVMTSE